LQPTLDVLVESAPDAAPSMRCFHDDAMNFPAVMEVLANCDERNGLAFDPGEKGRKTL